MDFQTRQDEAKQSTLRLVVLFVAGLVAIIAIVSLLLIALFAYGSGEADPLAAVAVAAPVTTAAIGGASLVKSSQIKSGGGSYVATSMGGRPVDFNTLDPAEKQLSNIVEEIAIASGMSVPAVFVLDNEPGINAFAAGWSADTAAIGVTRGALQHLDRAELQGVIAHEFAHIANGDTRVKTRIIGWVFGIAIITVLGRILLESLWWAPRRRDRDDRSAIVLLAAAIGLIVIGSVGTIFARMIQAAVSRQRELLADASAVQYTRDPSGLAGALRKIGGMSSDNRIHSAHATEAGHLFFASAMGSAFATHPPLKTRIARLIPGWDGTLTPPEPVEVAPGQSEPARPQGGWGAGQMLPGQQGLPGMGGSRFPFDPTILLGGALAGESGHGNAAGPHDDAVSVAPPVDVSPARAEGALAYQPPTFGGPTDDHMRYARSLLARIPEETQAYLHTRGGAVAAIVGLLAASEPELRARDLAYAASVTRMDADYLDAAGQVIGRLDRPLQLPAIDLALHSIRETPYEYQRSLAALVQAIDSSHPHEDLFRWVLRRVTLRHLEDHHDDGSTRHDRRLEQLHHQAITVYAAIAWFNSSGTEWAPGAFAAALAEAGIPVVPLPPVEAIPVQLVDDALAELARMNLAGRRAFVSGAMAAIAHDATTTADEAELIRVVADAVRLPVPPLLPV